MPEAFIVDAVRTPVGRRGGGLAGVHPADLGAHVLTALVGRTRHRPRGRRRGDPRLSRPGRAADRRHRQDGLAGSGPARDRAGHDHRPAMWLVPAGDQLRRAGRDERHQRPRGGGRRAEHVDGSDGLGFGGGLGLPLTRSAASVGWTPRRYGDAPGFSQFHGAGADRREVGIGSVESLEEKFAIVSHERALAAAARGPVRRGDRPDKPASRRGRRPTNPGLPRAKIASLKPLIARRPD